MGDHQHPLIRLFQTTATLLQAEHWMPLPFVKKRARALKRLPNRIACDLYKRLKAVEQNELTATNLALLSQFKSRGRDVGIWGRVYVTGADQIEIGSNVHIGDNAFIRAEGGLTIGDNTHISRNLVLYTINHRYTGHRLPYDDEMEQKPVRIGRNVWIGMNVCIVPGSTIGDGAIVGMGTVVSGDVPPLSIIGNQRWRILGQRDEAHYHRLDELEAYGGPNGRSLQ